jgi:uncharacterized protein YegL
MKNSKTYYQLILDKSGSMSCIIEQTIEGVNQQIMRIKEVAGRYPDQELYTSLTFFNHGITRIWNRIPSTRLQEISFSDYRPAGTTALLDAVGLTIDEMQKTIGDEIERGEATAVVVIFTDGYENASRAFTHRQVSSMIADLESTGKWTFSYIGATLDAVEIAMTLNIKQKNAMHFSVNDSRKMYSKLDSALENYISQKSHNKIVNDNYLNDDDEQ